MNIVLFEERELKQELALSDERAVHVLKVLRRKAGDDFDVGLVNGPKGKAVIEKVLDTGLVLGFQWGESEPDLLPIDLVVGLSRPQTMRKVLNEATTLGVKSIRFVATDRGEPSYAESKLWSTGEWRRHVLAGVAQAFTTREPAVSWGMTLEEALAEASRAPCRLALDNYEGSIRLGKALGKVLGSDRVEASRPRSLLPVALAVGSERGWTAAERDLFRERGWTLVGLGARVLRTETAVVASVAVVRESMGIL